MKTKVRTAHEEQYVQSEKNKTIGVLENYSFGSDKFWKESFVYVYHEGMYIFFDTIINMFDYLLYGSNKMHRAYMEEDEFDGYYDADFIDGIFRDKLEWISE